MHVGCDSNKEPALRGSSSVERDDGRQAGFGASGQRYVVGPLLIPLQVCLSPSSAVLWRWTCCESSVVLVRCFISDGRPSMVAPLSLPQHRPWLPGLPAPSAVHANSGQGVASAAATSSAIPFDMEPVIKYKGEDEEGGMFSTSAVDCRPDVQRPRFKLPAQVCGLKRMASGGALL